jgi:hypothetical protein
VRVGIEALTSGGGAEVACRAFSDVDEFVDEAKRVETVRRDDASRRRSGDMFNDRT